MKALFVRLALVASAVAGVHAADTAAAGDYTIVPSSTIGTYVFVDPSILLPDWRCRRGDGTTCSSAELGSPSTYRQVLVLGTGYTSSDKSQFFIDAETLREKMSNVPGSSVYSRLYKNRLLYVTSWRAGGSLTSGSSAYGGKVFAHPVRGKALTINQSSVYNEVTTLKSSRIPQLNPVTVVVIYNTKETGITANATPPSYTGRAYGIARVTAGGIQGYYIGAHEVGHSLLSFVDEYVEGGFEEVSIKQFDILTPLAVFNGSLKSLADAVGDLFGVYDINISEILAHNGADNIATTRNPSTVGNSYGLARDVYEHEGGFFFGRGTYHDTTSNLMNGSRVQRGSGDSFAYNHSNSQKRIVETVFNTHKPGRANDRTKAAGPVNGWPLEFGSTTKVMMFDADKNHRWHKTTSYNVQVGWYEREWKTCWQWGIFPYPCYEWKWRTAQKTVTPTLNTINLGNTSLFGLSSFVQRILCGVGLSSLGGIDICSSSVDEMAGAFLPTTTFRTPYQSTSVPASQWFTKYWWRFRTYNGRYYSHWTGWSSFYRSF